MSRKTSLVLNTVRYMAPRQWKYRLYYTVRGKLGQRKPKKPKKEIQVTRLSLHYYTDIRNEVSVSEAEKICAGQIPTVSGLFVDFSGDWNLEGQEYRLVSFRLNSFRWLIDLSDAYKETKDIRYVNKGLEYIDSWQNSCGSLIIGDKWNAYVIAERITNWIGFISEYCSEEDLRKRSAWIYSQAYELRNSVEYQLGANHLLSEAKALIAAGVFLNDDELYSYGKKLLLEESREQFLSDGGHYERSVSYHVESLQQLFEAFTVMKAIGDSDEQQFVQIMKKPYCFLNNMIGVDGRIPLFNDSAYDYPFFDAADFLDTSRYVFVIPAPKGKGENYSKRWDWLGKGSENINWDVQTREKSTGFIHYRFSIDDTKHSFFMDCGDNGPDYNLGHTHADSLSILLSSEAGPILVDSGVFTYRPSNERDSCRSTKAHNTVEIDSADNAEVWAAFRVAKRGHTKILDYNKNDGLYVKASHDGYVVQLKSPVIHTREAIIRNGEIVIIDTLDGKGTHRSVSRFHVSPRCKLRQVDLNTCIVNEYLTLRSSKEIRISDCSVAEMFGRIEKSKCVEIDFQGATSLKTVFSFVTTREE